MNKSQTKGHVLSLIHIGEIKRRGTRLIAISKEAEKVTRRKEVPHIYHELCMEWIEIYDLMKHIWIEYKLGTGKPMPCKAGPVLQAPPHQIMNIEKTIPKSSAVRWAVRTGNKNCKNMKTGDS